MRSVRCRNRIVTVAVFSALAGRGLVPAMAADSWAGGSGSWDTPASWSTGVVPSASDDAVFNVSTNDAIAQTITIANGDAANSLTFGDTGATGFSGGGLTLGAGGLTINPGAGAFSLNSPSQLILAASETWTNNSSNGAILGGASFAGIGIANTANAITLTFAGPTNFSIYSLPSNSVGGGVFSVIVNNGGNVTINKGGSSYTGGTTITSGSIRDDVTGALGGGLITLGNSIGSTATANLVIVPSTTLANSINVLANGVSSITAGGSGNTEIFSSAATVTLGNTLTINSSASSGSSPTFTFNSDITGVGGIVLASGGKVPFVNITHSNDFSGGTTVNAGAGTLNVQNIAGLGVTGAALNLAGGLIDFATDTTVNAYNTTVTGTTTIESDKATAASAGITQTLGTLNIGANTLNILAGANVSGGTPIIAFGAVTLSSATTGTTTFNPTTAGLTMTSVSGSAAGTKTNTLALGGTSATSAVTGVIADGGAGGNVALSDSSTGTWTLTGQSTYSGTTAVTNGGTLVVDATSTAAALAGTSSVTVIPTTTASTTLKLICVTGTAGSTVNLINSNAAIVVSASGSQKGILDLDFVAGAFNPVASFKVGTAAQDPGFYGSSNFFVAAGINTNTLTPEQITDEGYFADSGGISVAPEPGSIGLIGLGALLLQRRRRHACLLGS